MIKTVVETFNVQPMFLHDFFYDNLEVERSKFPKKYIESRAFEYNSTFWSIGTIL
jgi:hypothetical protein